ncbi:MAG: flagellar basal body rod protein FlgC [Phycisphaerae bacterium]|nr:flagellar basal body rod protein FlgC [Phycisphaerae bacterium]
MYGSLDISTSGMIAQRHRMSVIAANIANRNVILDEHGQVNPYRRREVMFAPGDPTAATEEGRSLGVHVADISINQGPASYHWDPTSPYAFKSGPKAGYVPDPDVDIVTEQINAMEASRAYEANVAAAEASKAMIAQALRLLA